MSEMFEAQTMDFPFVAEMPKRERSKVASIWDRYQELKRITEEKGMLLPVMFCVSMLGVSKQRVYTLLDEGRMERVEINGQVFITEQSFIDWCRAEHKSGRPTRVQNVTLKDCLTIAREAVKAK